MVPSLINSTTPSSYKNWLSSKPLKRALGLLAFLSFLYFFLLSETGIRSRASILPDRIRTQLPPSNTPHDDDDFVKGRNHNRSTKPRAAFVSLIRERNLNELLSSLRDIQWAFNDDLEHGYDFIFLSEIPFTPWFQNHVNDFLSKRPSKPKARFGLVSKEDWDVPAHIDMVKAKERWRRMSLSGRVPYGGSKSYRQMCRYMSGPIYQHPLLKDVDYLWRLEPETKHLCEYKSHWKTVNGKAEWVERDPFRYMRDHKKKYGWVISTLEYRTTVMTLMAHINHWRSDNPSYIVANNSLSFVSDDGKGYNLCHYWTNFEIIDLSFVRSPAYTSYFKKLDDVGGFFYERWGDAPVRSIAASMMLNRDEIWNIDFAGYYHPPYGYCPRVTDPGQSCACDPQTNIQYNFKHAECQVKWDKTQNIDSGALIQSINAQNGIQESFREGEIPFVFDPPRLSGQF
ncbi:hypothetical protein CBS101457_004499 [Exobasidium rhododendri]|nr:hypothetical protein CBS101457_004499 [Exobasidium rhododendri]